LTSYYTDDLSCFLFFMLASLPNSAEFYSLINALA
jgi:hypothetical protein